MKDCSASCRMQCLTHWQTEPEQNQDGSSGSLFSHSLLRGYIFDSPSDFLGELVAHNLSWLIFTFCFFTKQEPHSQKFRVKFHANHCGRQISSQSERSEVSPSHRTTGGFPPAHGGFHFNYPQIQMRIWEQGVSAASASPGDQCEDLIRSADIL